MLNSHFRSAERSNSAVHNRAIDSVSTDENITDAFVDLYDAIEKIESEKSKNESASSSVAQVKQVTELSLGDLLHMNIS